MCTDTHRECVNTPGSHLCVCAGGHEERDGECVPTTVPGKTSVAMEIQGQSGCCGDTGRVW